MTTKISRIAKIAKENPKGKFTSLYHLLNRELLVECHNELDGNKATGVDGVPKDVYGKNLDANIEDLVERLKNHSYRPQPVRRVYIPKGNGDKRPLGILSYEDKIVQLALKKILEAIYEQDFLECSYGFRPNLSCHKAIIKLDELIGKKTSFIVDADIRGFFNNVDHSWLVKFLSERIVDPNIIRLIKKFLKAGLMEHGRIEPTELGTPQGSVISPVLANVYLHYVLDIWFEKVVAKYSKGKATMVRYADDFVCCFQYKRDAYTFYEALKQRMKNFGLEISAEKSKIIEFGRFAKNSSTSKGKPGTFDFLGFTHYCSESRKGNFQVKRKTSRKKFNSKLMEFNEWMRNNRNSHKLAEILDTVKAKLRGHYAYYGISDNMRSLKKFKWAMVKILFKWLNRRSQRKSFEWEKFLKYLLINPLPEPKIYVCIHEGWSAMM